MDPDWGAFLISLVFAVGEPLLCLSSRLPSVNSVSVSLRHPHTLCLWSNTVTRSTFCADSAEQLVVVI